MVKNKATARLCCTFLVWSLSLSLSLSLSPSQTWPHQGRSYMSLFHQRHSSWGFPWILLGLDPGSARTRAADCPALYVQDPGTPGAPCSVFRVLDAGPSRSGLAWISRLLPATVLSSIPPGHIPRPPPAPPRTSRSFSEDLSSDICGKTCN